MRDNYRSVIDLPKYSEFAEMHAVFNETKKGVYYSGQKREVHNRQKQARPGNPSRTPPFHSFLGGLL